MIFSEGFLCLLAYIKMYSFILLLSGADNTDVHVDDDDVGKSILVLCSLPGADQGFMEMGYFKLEASADNWLSPAKFSGCSQRQTRDFKG